MADPRPERLAKLMLHLDTESPLEMLLRGHLWVEQELRAALDAVLAYPDQLESQGQSLSFATTVRLCAAHGLVHPAEVGGYRALNRLRNKLAHDAEMTITEKDAEDLVNALGPKSRFMYDGAAQDLSDAIARSWLTALRFSILTLFIALQVESERREDSTRRLRDSARHLLAVHARAQGNPHAADPPG